MRIVNVHDAKTNLSSLLASVSLGEEIHIARAGQPVAKLVALQEAIIARTLGADQGVFSTSDDFNTPVLLVQS